VIYRSRVLWAEDENGRKKEMEMTRKKMLLVSELLGFIFWVRGE
jgi:hypothetical protein